MVPLDKVITESQNSRPICSGLAALLNAKLLLSNYHVISQSYCSVRHSSGTIACSHSGKSLSFHGRKLTQMQTPANSTVPALWVHV